MFKVIFSKKTLEKIDIYISAYRQYHEEIYQDSWIRSERQIIDGYAEESKYRYFEMLEILERNMSENIISYPNNQAIIRWRSKILLVSFTTTQDTRIITDIEIR